MKEKLFLNFDINLVLKLCQPILHSKLLAKLGADRVKPDACCVVKDWRHFLDGLSLRKIPGVGYKFQKRLEPLGITDVNNVWDLGDDAEKVLGEIIGQGNARKIVKFCHGEDSRPVTPGPRKSIGAEVSVVVFISIM